MPESDAVTSVGIVFGVGTQFVDIGRARQQAISNGYRKNGVVREPAFLNKERKLTGLLSQEFVDRAYDITGDRSQHPSLSLPQRTGDQVVEFQSVAQAGAGSCAEIIQSFPRESVVELEATAP
jgi:hypothetical protein